MPSTARLVSLYNNALHLQRAVAYAMSPLRARARIYPTSEDTIWCSLFFGNQLIYSYLISVRVNYVYSLSLLLIFSQVRWFKVALQLTLYYTDWFYISAPPACNVQHLHLVRPSYTRIDTFTQVWYVQLYNSPSFRMSCGTMLPFTWRHHGGRVDK